MTERDPNTTSATVSQTSELDERAEGLFVKVADGTASAAEREELMGWIGDDPARRAELETQRAVGAGLDGLLGRLEHDRVLDAHRKATLTRVEERAGTGLVGGGLALLLGYGALEWFVDETLPPAVRAGLLLLAAGAGVLLASVLRERRRQARADPYTEVQR